MSKFTITETQIDTYNDTHNQLNRFEEGLNIICGENEAGKSTLMEFIKSIFIRKNDAKGYVKCSCDGIECVLRAEKNKRKENEKYLEKINAYGYKTGFVINLDDIMFAKKADSEELVNTIKDSSGNAINQKQEEYENYIYGKNNKFYLTSKNIESTSFKNQFKKLININKEIIDLQGREDRYNDTCRDIEQVEEEIKNLTKSCEISRLVLQKNTLEDELKNIKINTKLLEYKTEFESLREEFGALNFGKQKSEELNKNLEKNKEKFDEKLRNLQQIEFFEVADLDEFNLDTESLNYAKNLIEKFKDLRQKKQQAESDKKEIETKIEELKFEVQSTANQLEMTGIKDFAEYQKDKDLLESYREHYQNLLNKAMNSASVNTRSANWYNEMFMLLFIGIFFASLGGLVMMWKMALLFRLIFIGLLFISAAGINTVFMEKLARQKVLVNNSYSQEMKKISETIKKLFGKYSFQFKKEDDFIVKAGSYLINMKDKISEYKIIETDLDKTKISLEKEKYNLEKKENYLKDLTKDEEKLSQEITEFLSETKVKNIENYPDIFDNIKELKYLNNQGKECADELEKIDKNLENFVENLNKFINNSGLDFIQKLNKYDYDYYGNTLAKIREVLDENISNERIIKEITVKKEQCEEELKKYTDDINYYQNVSEDSIAELDNELQKKRDEKAKLSQTKEDLEQVENLVGAKNERNIELNLLKESMSKLVQKEVIYNIIKSAKEKFNESQPNLVCAKKYLANITNSKYSEIDFENKTISGKDTPQKDWDKLSRGTKEQLYLALRLGYASNYSKDINGESNGIPDLPVIVDDAFVNFDEERLTSILKCLEEFSHTNQVFYFSCHTKMLKDILEKEKIKHNFIEL